MTKRWVDTLKDLGQTSEGQSWVALANVLSAAADSSDSGADLPLWFHAGGFESFELPVGTGQAARRSDFASGTQPASTLVVNYGAWRADAGERSALREQAAATVDVVGSEGSAGARAASGSATGPTVTIANGATITIDGPSARAVTFAGTMGTLKLEDPRAFTGLISELTGADAIDLSGFAYGANTTATYLGNATGGTLTVTDGAKTAHIALSGNYLSSTWTLSSDGKGGTTVIDPTLPPGVTLQQIDGGPNYYANNGLTYAHNAGWDNPDFFPIGAWAAPIQTTADATRWAQLGWNTAWVPAYANQSVIQAAGISLVISAQSGWTSYTNYGFTPGPETVGIETYDEPNNSSQFYNGMSTVPNSVQDGRFWWVNNTINWLDYGSPTTQGNQGAWLAAPQTTPDGTTRTINISSLDYYPFSRNDQYGPPSVSTTWGLSTAATSDQYRRGFLYGDIIDQERLDQKTSAPIMAIVENGGPFTTDTTASDYIQPAEMNWATWESIIHGARGVMYFNNTFGGPGVSDDDMNSAYFQSAETEATFTGTGSGTSLTVSSVTGQIFLGDVVSGAGVPTGATIVSQINGTEGGPGVYVMSQATTASSASLTATQPTSMYAQTEATDALIEQLAPVINSPFAEGYATVSPASGEKLPLPLANGSGAAAFGGIDLSVHWYEGGNVSNRGLQLSNGAYIFASTRDSEYATNIPATFTLADKNATSVTVVNENRTIPVSNGVFTDTFATGATIHIYQVNDGSSASPPTITGVTDSPSSGDLHAGKTVTLTLSFGEALMVAGGTPALTLNDGGTATYASGSGTGALTFTYTVAAGQNTASLAATAVNLPSGVTITDGAGNAAKLSLSGLTQTGPQIDTTAPAAPVISSDTVSSNVVKLNGMAEAGSTVTVYDGTTDLGATTTNGSGAWTYTTGALSTGMQTITATATDAAGNVSAASSAVNLTISAPTLTSETVTISGTAEEGQKLTANVTVDDPNATIGYQWQYENSSTWTNIAGATASTFTVSVPQEGEMLRVVATAADGATTLSATSSATTAVKAEPPALTIANNSLSVTAGGSVPLGVSVTIPETGDTVNVQIAGLPRYETITDALDGKTFKGSSVTLTAAEVDSGLTLKSTYKGARHPVATLTLTASNGASSAALTTTASQTLKVTDPPSQVSAGGSLDLANILYGSNTALGYLENSAGTGGGLVASDVHTATFGLLIRDTAAGFNFSNENGRGAIASYLEPAWSLTAPSSLTARSLIHA
jgi:Bacterial Ig-like domain